MRQVGPKKLENQNDILNELSDNSNSLSGIEGYILLKTCFDDFLQVDKFKLSAKGRKSK